MWLAKPRNEVEVEDESEALDLMPDHVSPDDDDHSVELDELPSSSVEPVGPHVGGEGMSFTQPSPSHAF